MLLWTIQPETVWQILIRDGIYRCDPKNSECLAGDMDFISSYDWMVEQMERRVGKRPEGVVYPVWAWHTYGWKHKKPDLRTHCFRGMQGIHACIEIDIPDETVLLSDEENWHYVLNAWFFSAAKSEKDYDRAEVAYNAIPENEKRKMKEASWERIFDVNPIETEWYRQGCYVQATFWELKLSQVKKVKWFGYGRLRHRQLCAAHRPSGKEKPCEWREDEAFSAEERRRSFER